MTWPLARRLTWILLLGLTVYGYGITIATSIRPPDNQITDLFQEWASAKNYFSGQPIYRPHKESALEYLGYRHDERTGGVFVEINGHPPPVVLLGLPLALFGYQDACLVWNLLSLLALVAALAMIFPEFISSKFSWTWLIVATLLLSNPLLQHIRMSQLGIFLLLLMMGAYRAEQRGAHRLAGVLLGTATAIKLFPAFMFAYFLVKRDWRALTSGILAFAAWNLVALACFGSETYHDFWTEALANVNRYRDSWANLTACGFWYRLFEASGNKIVPVWNQPALAAGLTQLSQALLTGVTLWTLARAPRGTRQEGFCVALIAMVLVSPIAWDHYLVLLIMPILVIARSLSPSSLVQFGFRVSLFFVWLNPMVVWTLCLMLGDHRQAPAWSAVALISWPFYGLLFLLGLSMAAAWEKLPEETSLSRENDSASPRVGRSWRRLPAQAEWPLQPETTASRG